jgi:hypothetical protein
MQETMKKVFEDLYKELPKDGIQRTEGGKTGKGYSTTGYGYQWIVDDLNNLFGFDWTLDWEIIHDREGKWENGKTFFELTVAVKLSINFEGVTYSRSMPGGNISGMWPDALKGAITNGIKKAAAMFGIGSDAFRGEIDEDNGEATGPGAGNYSSTSRLDFNDVVEKLKSMPPSQMKAYSEELVVNFPKMTDPQKNALAKIFSKAYSEKKAEVDPEPINATERVKSFFGAEN